MDRKTSQLRVVEKPNSELAALIDDYLAEMRARGLSPRSVDIARATLTSVFMGWAGKRDVSRSDQLTQAVLDALSRYLLEEHMTPQGKPLSRDSVRTYMRTMRTFIRWASKRGDVAAVTVPMPKATERAVKVLERDEIRRMEDAAGSERDKLIIRLLGDLGLRLGELLALRREDLRKDREKRFLHVYGKGSRERVIPIDPRLFSRLERYSNRPQAKKALTERIFTTERRHGDTYAALQPRTVQQMIRFVAQAAGIDKRVHPHLFRHSAITWMINSNRPVEHIRRVVGHTDLRLITSTYSHAAPDDLYESMLELIRKDEEDRRR